MNPRWFCRRCETVTALKPETVTTFKGNHEEPPEYAHQCDSCGFLDHDGETIIEGYACQSCGGFMLDDDYCICKEEEGQNENR